jgi:hypothetical protein
VRAAAALWSYSIRLAITVAFLTITVAAWVVVIIAGLLHPRSTPRRACDSFNAFLHESGRLIHGLDSRRRNR